MRKMSNKKKNKKSTNEAEEAVVDLEDEGSESDAEKQNGDTEETEKSEEKSKKKTKNAKKSDSDESEKESDVENKEDEKYEVQDIVNHKYERGKLQYLIRWRGYTEEDDTWEPESTLSCPDIVKKYSDANPDMKSKNKKRSKKTEKGNSEKKPKLISEQKEDGKEDEDDEKDWEVERIMDVHKKRNGSKEFLIRWKGYGTGSNTWEPEDNLNCPDLITKFMDKLEQAKNCNIKELRHAPAHTKRFTLMETSAGMRRLSKRNDGRQRAVYYDAE